MRHLQLLLSLKGRITAFTISKRFLSLFKHPFPSTGLHVSLQRLQRARLIKQKGTRLSATWALTPRGRRFLHSDLARLHQRR